MIIREYSNYNTIKITIIHIFYFGLFFIYTYYNSKSRFSDSHRNILLVSKNITWFENETYLRVHIVAVFVSLFHLFRKENIISYTK